MPKNFEELLQSEIKYHKALEAYERAEEQRARDRYQERLAKTKNEITRQGIVAQESLRRQKVALDALKEQAKADRDLFEEQQEAVTEMFEDIADSAEDSYGRIEKAQDALEKKILKGASTFHGVTIHGGGELEGEYTVFRDFDLENKQLERYKELLGQLETRTEGLLGEDKKAFFEEFAKMDIKEGTASVEAMLRVSDQRLSEYVAGWRAFQENTENFAKGFYAADYEALSRELEAQLEQAFGQVPEGFWDQGRISAKAFGEGFLEEFAAVMADISAELSQDIVARLPLEVAQGMQNQNVYNNTYHLASSGETVAQQLRTIQAAETRAKLRAL